jgi:starch phosphorylase
LARVSNDGTEMTGVELRRMLEGLASNLAFSWLPAVRNVFRDLDPDDWEESDHNPIVLLAGLTDDRFERLAGDDRFVGRVIEAVAAMTHELAGPTWWADHHPDQRFLAAYFSTEFALDESLPVYSGGLGVLAGDHLKSASELGVPLVGVGLFYARGYFRQTLDESLPVYSGGLGVLAGDHLKSASELGVPLVGVGLFYARGYFRQTLDETGWQKERYPINNPARLPLTLERRPSGEPLHVHVELAGEPVALQIWRADIGRTRLYLLDANVDTNSDSAASITDKLYGGDREHRIKQEYVLGVGGVRALRRLGLEPTVFHMNEGHSVLLAIERLRELTAAGSSLEAALELVRDSTVFTTHTPVPAGNEVFDAELVRKYLAGLVGGIGMDWDSFLALGRVREGDLFGLTPLALRLSGRANAVSKLHGEVAREMWQALGVPIGSVTNGVHPRTWLAADLDARIAGDWSRVHEVPDDELWRIHVQSKRELAAVARARGASLGEDADEDVLTIGFARRFATYKRAGLLFSDPDRLARLLADADRPVKVMLAGKAHPADEGGKKLIQHIWELSQEDRFRGRVVFLEDYEMTLARNLVQGVDVWLNTPRRPQEASGTSGMKAAMNGVLNLSILDGWWAEAYTPETGFAIPDEEAANDDAQDARDSAALFDVLESEVVPRYYERDDRGLPARWLTMMRASIEELGRDYNTNRMVREYVDELYLPAHAALAAAAL